MGTKLMSDEGALRGRARELIESNTLPLFQPTRIWGGNGLGTPCAVCGDAVPSNTTGYELEFGEDRDSSGFAQYHVHLACFAAWEAESQRLKTATASAAGISKHPPQSTRGREPGPSAEGPLRESVNARTISARERSTYKKEPG
jgi:hypothetical protein